MKSTKILALILVVAMCFTMLASCGLFGKCDHVDADDNGKCDKCGENYEDGAEEVDDGTVSYNTTTVTMPSNWNELNYSDNNDTQIMSYIGSSFFTYDYKFDGGKFKADGTVNLEGIVPGAFITTYSAATKLEDVTSAVDAKWGYTDEQKAEGGYAWKITLRDDLKWDDGTPITAADFEYSMKAQLDPAFMNFRANTYYDTLKVKNSRGYFFQDPEGTYESVTAKGFESNQAALDAGEVLYVDLWAVDNDLFGWGLKTAGLVDEQGNAMPQYLAYNDERIFNTPEGWETGSEDWLFSVADAWGYIAPGAGYGDYTEPGGGYLWVTVFVENLVRDVAWEDVGMYAIEEENAIVVCLDKAYSLLNEDGSLGVWAAYYMSSLPLVHKAKYEESKKAPVEGSTLWTTNYNSSLATTASWGPYKLVEFEAGSHYKLAKNEHWYGWNMEDYNNQYPIDVINCRKVEEFTTRWMGFLNGDYDDASLQTENVEEYADSKYVYYAPEDGTYGMQLYSNLPVLKASGNNNGILAIQEFRHAFSLALNRNNLIENIWPGTAAPCLGIVSTSYFYDIENSTTLADGGVYRNTVEAKEGLLRAYGFVQDENGKWSSGTLTDLTLDEAYEALSGYNPALAKEKLKEAIEILNANADYYGYDSSKDITIVYGSSSDDSKQKKRCEYLQGIIDDLASGTALEGKIKLKFDASASAKWAEAFRSGATQIGFGYGFGGNPFNPFSIPGLFVDTKEDLNYHQYWDTSAIDLTITLPEGDYEGAGQTITMPVDNWFYCLNGLAEDYGQVHTYNWDAGFAPVNTRLVIFAALEEVILKECRSVMLIESAGGSFLGAKFSYASEDYNTFMGFGGIRYIQIEYTDFEWKQFVKANGNDLSNEYKKSE